MALTQHRYRQTATLSQEQGMFNISCSSLRIGCFLGIKNEEYAKALYRYKKAKSRYVFLQKDDTTGVDVIAKVSL